MKFRRILSLLCVVSLSFFPKTAIAVDSSTATFEIGGGGLSATIPTSFALPPITLDGENYKISTTTVGKLRVNDSRGTGAGWKLTVEATQFTEVGGLGLKIPKGNFLMYAPTDVYPIGETTGTPPTLGTGYFAIDNGPYTVAVANANAGLGTFEIAFDAGSLELDVAPSLKLVDKVNYPNTPTPYESTITWTLSATP